MEKSAVQLVDDIVLQAIAQNASDIHAEPSSAGLVVKFRIDGTLHEYCLIDQRSALEVVARIKVLARLDVAEKRLPQDGKWHVHVSDRIVDVRVATFPTLHGEKIALRILDNAHQLWSLASLGMDPSMLQEYKNLIDRSRGFVLVTGPTGAGKTTTLYATLLAVQSPEKNIVTLEDPIEYSIDGVCQAQVFSEIGFTFAKGLRSLVRQDPDVILVGEIRDRETAEVAINAALTGHLVLSSLHTNDAPSALIRLLDMGVEPFLLNAAMSGVLAQRLARRLCQACRTEVVPDQRMKDVLDRCALKIDRFFKAPGCSACNGCGFKGRIGIFELLVMTPALRELLRFDRHVDAIYAQAYTDGMRSLLHDGAEKVAQGLVSLEEMVRVLW